MIATGPTRGEFPVTCSRRRTSVFQMRNAQVRQHGVSAFGSWDAGRGAFFADRIFKAWPFQNLDHYSNNYETNPPHCRATHRNAPRWRLSTLASATSWITEVFPNARFRALEKIFWDTYMSSIRVAKRRRRKFLELSLEASNWRRVLRCKLNATLNQILNPEGKSALVSFFYI